MPAIWIVIGCRTPRAYQNRSHACLNQFWMKDLNCNSLNIVFPLLRDTFSSKDILKVDLWGLLQNTVRQMSGILQCEPFVLFKPQCVYNASRCFKFYCQFLHSTELVTVHPETLAKLQRRHFRYVSITIGACKCKNFTTWKVKLSKLHTVNFINLARIIFYNLDC